MHSSRFYSNRRARRATVVVYTAICMTVVMGMAALAVDIGALYQAQAELQRTADGAALAAAGQLIAEGVEDHELAALDAAAGVAERNQVLRGSADLNLERDVEFGRATYSEATGRYTFQPGGAYYDAVRVTVRRTQGSPGGPIELMFARFLGHDTRGLEARAAAVLVPRDIAVVIDLSGSMSYDSELRYWNRGDGGYPNTRDIWCALDGPEPERPYLPGSETETEYADDLGPTIGAMSEWGSPLFPTTYAASTDPGLWYIQKGSATSDPNLLSDLSARGYNTAEINALKKKDSDSSGNAFRNRAAVMLGLANWRSGKAGACYPGTPSNGDDVVNDNELIWIAYPPYRVNWTWYDFIDYVQGSSISNTTFRYRYGLKTYVDFLLQAKRQYSQTNILWATPQQPLRAVKDAVQALVDVVTALDSQDHLSLEVFATGSRHEVDLSADLQSIADRLYDLQAAHYDTGQTSIGAGLSRAISELTSERSRPNAHKVILLMSDGVPNTDENGNSNTAAARQYALDMADRAVEEHIRIYSISVGYAADRPLMQEIAAKAFGREDYAAGNPEEYTEQLNLIFRTLGGRRQVALIE